MSIRQNLTKFTNDLGKMIIKRSPELLAGAGIACFLASTVSAVIVTPEASKRLEEKKMMFTPVDGKTEDTKLPLKETVKTVWKLYLPAGCMAIGGTCFIVSSVSTSNARYMALSSSYELLREAAYTYRDKVVETIGEKKEKKIREEIAQDKLDKDKISDKAIVITPNGNTLFKDSLTGQFFRYDINQFKNKAYQLADWELSENYVGVPEWLLSLGLNVPDTMMGMGWSTADQGKVVQIDFTPCVARQYNDEPCLVVDYYPMPISDFNIYYK